MAVVEIQARIERFGRLYVASSQVSRLVMRCQSREELLRGVVRILVDVGKFAMSSISCLDPVTRQLVPVSRFGEAADYVDRAPMFADDRLEGQGPAGTAFRRGVPYVCNDFLNDPATVPWRAAAQAAGWLACAAFPVFIGGEPHGILSVYGREVGMFGIDQVELLQQVTLDLAFGLEHLAGEQERRRVESALQESEAKFRDLFDSAPVAYHELDRDGVIRAVNQAECALLGYAAADMLGRPVWDFIAEDDRDASRAGIQRRLCVWEPLAPVRRHFVRRDGGEVWLEIHHTPVGDAAGKVAGIRGALIDITGIKRAEDYRELDREVLRILNKPGDLQEAVERILAALNSLTGCDAIGLRLQAGEDFPYFAEQGFSQDFLWTENTLIACDAAGRACRDADGAVRLECTCGLVIAGRTDPANPLFTRGGSFWTNDSFPLLDLTPAEDPRLHPRNQCIKHGFASVALIPIRNREKIVGLLQLNDRRKGAFTLDTIEHLEGIASHIGEALMRKRAEEELRESEGRYRSILSASPDAIAITDLEGRIRLVSPVALPLFGYQREDELLGRSIVDFILPEDRDRASSGVARMFMGLKTGPDEFRGVRLDGSTIDTEVNAEFIRDARGRPTSMVFIVRDITARRRAEAAQRESERQLLESQRVARLGSYKLDIPAGVWKSSVVLDEVFGIDEKFPHSVEGWLSLIHPDCREEMADHFMRHVLGQKDRFDKEYKIVRHGDGQERWVHGLGELEFDSEGRPVTMFGTIFDITERKREQEEKSKLEAQFHQAQKMESVGRLAGGVAHDFNNLLTVINGYSHMLLTAMRPDDPLRDSLEEIHRAGERAAGLTRQLLAFSRKQVLEPRKLDVNRVVGEMRPMLERLVGEDVEVYVALHAEGGTIHADPHQLEQVVMNLVVNARDAMPGVGKLLVETAIVERDESFARSHPEARVGRYVMLAVSDTGIGMDEATKSRIFEPFFTTKPTGKGTGLGLSMVQGIVAQSGGYVEVYSEKGNGTTFKIYLPALTEGAADTAQPTSFIPLGGKEAVLVVEDQPEVRKYVVAVLREYGYRAIAAESPHEALSFCERERVHLVLTDVVMPNLSGKELAGQLQAVQPGLKVLFMSGYTDSVIEHHGVLEEGALFIQKPFSPEELAGKVREVLGPVEPEA